MSDHPFESMINADIEGCVSPMDMCESYLEYKHLCMVAQPWNPHGPRHGRKFIVNLIALGNHCVSKPHPGPSSIVASRCGAWLLRPRHGCARQATSSGRADAQLHRHAGAGGSHRAHHSADRGYTAGHAGDGRVGEAADGSAPAAGRVHGGASCGGRSVAAA